MLGVKSFQRHAASLFHNGSKFSQKFNINTEVLKLVKKHLFKLLLKSISKFPKVLKSKTEKRWSKTIAFRFSSLLI